MVAVVFKNMMPMKVCGKYVVADYVNNNPEIVDLLFKQ